MTTIDPRPAVLDAEPANNTFVVWYDPNREPYAVYFRSDANAWDDDRRWFTADQMGGDLDGPFAWADLSEELHGNDGPHLLVPDATVAELTRERDDLANLLDQTSAARDRFRRERDFARDMANAARAKAADLLRALDHARAVVEAARQAVNTDGVDEWNELVDAVDALPKAEVAR